MKLPLPASVMLVLASGLASAQSPPSYEVRFLGYGTSGSALNELGVAVGWIDDAGVSRAAISFGGEPMQPLPLPVGYVSSMALDVNDLGLVVGTVSPYTWATIQPHAAAWRPTPAGYVAEVLGEPAGDSYSAALGVNDLGDIIGSSGTTPWFYWVHGVHFAAGGPVVLPGLDAAEDVNDEREVLFRNALLDLDTMTVETIPLPPGNWNGLVPYALNELGGFAGTLIGYSSTCGAFPMRYLPSSGWTYVGGCGQNTGANAINDLGDVLTWAGTWAYGVHFEGLGYFGFGSLIDPSQGAWITGSGGDINNRRQMLVGVRDPLQSQGGVALLTPLGTQCQEDLGYAGPGNVRLSMCGDLLTFADGEATLTVSGVKPFGIVVLAIGTVANPTPLFGGTFVPSPWTMTLTRVADGQGNVSVVVRGAGGPPMYWYTQAVELAGGGVFRFSNALRVARGQ